MLKIYTQNIVTKQPKKPEQKKPQDHKSNLKTYVTLWLT